MRVPSLVLVGLMTFSVSHGAAQSPRNSGAPETFSANAQVKAGAGSVAATIQIQIQRYTPDFDRTAVETALKQGGYPGFVTALRKAPEVGSVTVGDQKFPIRWAREQKTDKGRTIVVVTDKPVFFVGGGRTECQAARRLRSRGDPADGGRDRTGHREHGRGRARQARRRDGRADR